MKRGVRQWPGIGGSVKLAVASVLAVALTASYAPTAVAEGNGAGGQGGEQLAELFQPETPTDEGFEALRAELPDDFDSETLDQLIAPTVDLPVGVDAPSGYATVLPELGDEISLSGGSLEGSSDVVITAVGSSTTSVTDGVAVSDSADGSGLKAMAHTTSGGGQIAFLIEGERSAPEATFAVSTSSDTRWEKQSDGGLKLIDALGNPLVTINKPWAIDANGQQIATHFETGDGYFKQVVDTEGAAFPIVADPSAWWYAKKATLCLANIAAFGSIAAKAASVGTKIAKRLKAAKSGTKLYEAYQAWKKMGGSNADRAKALWSTLKEFAKEVKNVGFAKARHKVEQKGSKYKYGMIVLFGAAGVVADVLGVKDCIALVKGREV
ncbi:hypothetical protein CJ197_09460 [Brachybacterium sp. UMB0905]|nr:hypothetical protein CJ197_09460 [Brachybacterium sp. UMB0905]